MKIRTLVSIISLTLLACGARADTNPPGTLLLIEPSITNRLEIELPAPRQLSAVRGPDAAPATNLPVRNNAIVAHWRFDTDERARTLTGVVTDPDGKAVQGARVAVFPAFAQTAWVRTDSNGAFSLRWSVQPWQLESGGDPVLVAREFTRNLAAIENLDPQATNLNVKLSPAVTLKGRVEQINGAPLANANVGVWLLACRTQTELDEQQASTDAEGRFEIKAVPPGSAYTVFAKASNFGRHRQEIEVARDTNQIELETFVLKAADQIVAGLVLDENDKPVSGAHVSLSGMDQPDGSITTDSKGGFRFKVCDGDIRLFASGQNGWGNVTAEPGETNVVIQLASAASFERRATARPSLENKSLPDLAPLGLPENISKSGKPLLLCLIDAEQRPSRHVARLLAGQAEALKEKGAGAAIVQARVISEESWQSWTNSSAMPFPVGRVADTTAGTKWAAGVSSLPWFILCDAQGKVAAEGFSLDELDSKLSEVKD